MLNDLIDKTLRKPVESYWIASTPETHYPSLTEDIKTDILIVGGGITGITTGYLLQREGLDVVIINTDKIATGTSGHTTAKITSQHDVIYSTLLDKFGEEKARMYGKANEDAIKLISEIISLNKIDCDFSNQSAYVYTQTENNISTLEREASVASMLGLPASFTPKISLPINIKGALCFENQAQFHPRKYLLSLADIFVKNGGRIYEDTTAIDIHDDKQCTTSLKNGCKVVSQKVIVASHFPFYDGWGFYSARMYPSRTYLMAVKASEQDQQNSGMYISYEEPARTIRFHSSNDGDNYILVGGEKHKTGQDYNENEHYVNIIKFANEIFHVQDIPYRWSAQDYIVMDEVPFIGHISTSRHNVLVATGFKKWGMSHSAVAAMIIKDTIFKGSSEYEEIFAPSRKSPVACMNFLKENLNVAENLISGKIKELPEEIDLKPGEGDSFEYQGRRAGAYRDEDGKLYIVDTKCKHLGCEVRWNSAEKTWDCPCHASRYNYKGEVIEGPALKNLERLD